MTRIGRRLIEDFLLPALNDQRYGDRLQWVDKSKYYFSIRWNHKNAAKWTLEDTVVFQDWDKLKGHFHPDTKGYYMQAKQRFRAALYKLNTVRTVHSQNKHVKIYQLVLDTEKRKGAESPAPASPAKAIKGETGIPTSVICRNNSYVPPKAIPAVKLKIDDYGEQLHLDIFSESSNHSSDVSTKCDEKPEEKVHWNQRHLPVQPTPVYCPGSMRRDIGVNNAYLMSRCNPVPSRNFVTVDEMHLQEVPPISLKYHSSFSSHAFKTRIDESDRSFEECDEVLNLSLKPDSFQTNKIPVSAR